MCDNVPTEIVTLLTVCYGHRRSRRAPQSLSPNTSYENDTSGSFTVLLGVFSRRQRDRIEAI